MIKSGELDNRMADPKGSGEFQEALRDMKPKVRKADAATGDALDLAARIRAAREIPLLRAPDLHCAHCFGEGREAAIRAFEAPVDGA